MFLFQTVVSFGAMKVQNVVFQFDAFVEIFATDLAKVIFVAIMSAFQVSFKFCRRVKCLVTKTTCKKFARFLLNFGFFQWIFISGDR